MANDPTISKKEYIHRGVPSPLMTTYSNILDLLYTYLKENQITLLDKTIADLGCGRGANTFSLINNGAKKVYAIDFVSTGTNSLIAISRSKGISRKIEALCHDLAKPWPIPNGLLDIILDIHSFKHQTDALKQVFYKSEINSKLKTGGLLLLEIAAPDDEYYGSLDISEIKPNVFKVIDPVTGVASLIYNQESLLREFPNYDVINIVSVKIDEEIHGEIFTRSTLQFLLKKQ